MHYAETQVIRVEGDAPKVFEAGQDVLLAAQDAATDAPALVLEHLPDASLLDEVSSGALRVRVVAKLEDALRCRVLQGGAVQVGDTLRFHRKQLRVLVLTLSDRAARGEYADRSGPAVEERLRTAELPWAPLVTRQVLPDDAGQLERVLREQIHGGCDVIFTTGGTGLAPRDITPDVVLRVAEKTIPGIMEHIRVKYGAQKPLALLSRSVAAAAKETLIFTLPGSPRAVGEYLDEILPILPHALLVLQGAEVH